VDAFFELMDGTIGFFDCLFPVAAEDLIGRVKLGAGVAHTVQRVVDVLEPEFPGRLQTGRHGGFALLLQSCLDVTDGIVHVPDGLTFVPVEDVFSVFHLLPRFAQVLKGFVHVFEPGQVSRSLVGID